MIHYYFFKVVYKDGTGHGSSGSGNGWTTVMGKMKQLSVGSQVMMSTVEIESNIALCRLSGPLMLPMKFL